MTKTWAGGRKFKKRLKAELLASLLTGRLLDLLAHLALGIVDGLLHILCGLFCLFGKVLGPREAWHAGNLAGMGAATIRRLRSLDKVFNAMAWAGIGGNEPGRRVYASINDSIGRLRETFSS